MFWVKNNHHKSLLIGINVDELYIVGLSNLLFYNFDSLPTMYLGLPLGANPNIISTWKSIIFKIRMRLHTWKGKLLSLEGQDMVPREKERGRLRIGSVTTKYEAFFKK